MTKENKKKWIKALRSGKYKQGKGQLKDKKDRYCCLGVACEIGITESIEEILINSTNLCVAKNFISTEMQSRLAILNDSSMNFIELSNWIEKHL